MKCNQINQAIIEAVIRKAELLCPNSLALIGIYGSYATGDAHEKSDLDLLILINDAQGRRLANAFILDDAGIGYDLYCTDWESLEKDADCNHAHLSKLMDSVIVYEKDPTAVPRLEALKNKVRFILTSEKRFDKASAALGCAKRAYADCILSDTLALARTNAGLLIHYSLDALMLFHGRYFQKGVKRTFEELTALALPFDIEKLITKIITAETPDAIRAKSTELLRTVTAYLTVPVEKAVPNQGNLAGTYEEMFSNWRNKMHEATVRNDLFSSFMNAGSCQHMLCEIADAVAIDPPDLMGDFAPDDLDKNATSFDDALQQYLKEYQNVGIAPQRFTDIQAFQKAYLQA